MHDRRVAVLEAFSARGPRASSDRVLPCAPARLSSRVPATTLDPQLVLRAAHGCNEHHASDGEQGAQ